MKIKMSEVFDLQIGKTPARNNPAYWGGKRKWVSVADIGNSGKYIYKTKEMITDLGVQESGIRKVPKGTVIMSFKLSIGKTAIVTEDMYTNEAIVAFIDKREYPIDPNYLYHVCNGINWTEKTNKAVMGLVLNKAILSDQYLMLPDLNRQCEIAKILDKIDMIIAIRQKQAEGLEYLIKARFVEMFGDLASPDCVWKREKLVDVCSNSTDIKCGPFGTQLNKDEYCSNGIAVWEIPQINDGFTTKPIHYITKEKADQLDAYSIKSGDIAMSRKGNVGRCAVFPNTFECGIIHSDVLRIRIDNEQALPVFLMYQLHFSSFIQHQIELVSSGAIMAGINVTKLKQIEIHLPPLELQKQFVDFVAQVDKSKFCHVC